MHTEFGTVQANHSGFPFCPASAPGWGRMWWMQRLACILESASDVMAALGVFPVSFEADPGGASIVVVMTDQDLYTRSVGPYSREELPPEAISLARRISLIWGMRRRGEQVDLNLPLDAPWAELEMRVPDKRIYLRFVVPEAVPDAYVPDRGDATAEINVRLALKWVAQSIALAGVQLPMSVSVSYPPTDGPHEFALPVIPTVDLDRRHCGRRERVAHNETLKRTAYSDQLFEWRGRTGFITTINFARIRDLH